MAKLNNIIKRVFTKTLETRKDITVFDLFAWKKVDVLIKDHKTNKIITDMRGLEFPEFFSQNACDIIASKYFRKAGVPNELGYENSMKQVAHRIVKFWVEALCDEKLLDTDEEKNIFYDEMVYGFLNQMYAPNSPQWLCDVFSVEKTEYLAA